MEIFFRLTGPLWRESIGHQWIPITEARDAGLFSWIWLSSCANNWKAGDLRSHRAHYQVIVMAMWIFDDFFAVNPSKLLTEHSSVRWFETPWHSCDATVMTQEFWENACASLLCYSVHYTIRFEMRPLPRWKLRRSPSEMGVRWFVL